MQSQFSPLHLNKQTNKQTANVGTPGSGLEKTWYWSCISHPHPTRELKESDEEKETRSDQEQKVCKTKGMKKKRGNEGTETRVFWKVRVPSPHSHHTGLRAQALP